MLKSKLNYKIINILAISITIYFIYQAKEFWISVVRILKEILLPFFIAFSIVYFLNPIINKLIKRNIPYKISVLIVIILVLLIISITTYLLIPILLEQSVQLIETSIELIKEINNKTSIDFTFIQKQLTTSFEKLVLELSSNIPYGAINILSVSTSIIIKIMITTIITIYLLFDYKKIKTKIKNVINKNKKLYEYTLSIDRELNNYLSGFYKIIIVSFFEYTIIYYTIGHPKALILGFIASILNIIPYFGGIITNIIAFLTAFTVSKILLIKTIIVLVVFSVIDGYIINPYVYNKTNEIHPIIIIFSAFLGEKLFGILGIIFSLPIAIIMINTYIFLKNNKKMI